MENFFDLPIDFDTMSSTPPFSFDDQDSQEGDLFEEITQGPHRRYLCSYPGCGKIFKFRSEITRHVIIHQNDRPYRCKFAGCKKNFKRADALENHMQTHAQVLPYACDIAGCDKKFATKAAIRYHKIKHDNNRVFKCGFPGCKRSFLTSSQLKQHEKSFNAHFRYSLFKVKEEEPIKFIKGEPQYLFQEFSMPIPKPASCLHWEIRGEDQEENNTEGSETENSSVIFTHFEIQNNVQQEEMQECEQWAALFENKNQPQLQTSYSIESQQTSDSCRFFDSSEIKLLEFLKNQDLSGTSVL